MVEQNKYTGKGNRLVCRHLPLGAGRTKEHCGELVYEFATRGCQVWSDGLASYKSLKTDFKHASVVHEREFKSAEGVCTNIVEACQGGLKRAIRSRIRNAPLGEDNWANYVGAGALLSNYNLANPKKKNFLSFLLRVCLLIYPASGWDAVLPADAVLLQ